MPADVVSASLEQTLDKVRFDSTPRVAALIEKSAPGIHALRSRVQVAETGFAGDHPRKSYWRGQEVPGRDVTAVAAEVLEALEIPHDVPGDNLITAGVDLRSLDAGDRLVIGDVVLRRSAKPHEPCDTFARRTSRPSMRAIAQTNHRGALFVVEKGGEITLQDEIRIVRGESE